ncbi:hypothetical protein Tco_1362368 [Tanacetum coccineum]
MPRECLKIHREQSFQVRHYLEEAVVAKVSTSSSTPAVSPDVAELKDMVRALILDKKNQTPAPVKAVEQSCVTCGGGHSYQNCPATDGNIYRDNIQEYVSQAATANFNQGTGYRPKWLHINFGPPLSSRFKTIRNYIKTISIGETITIKTEGTISTKAKFTVPRLINHQLTKLLFLRHMVCPKLILTTTSRLMSSSVE